MSGHKSEKKGPNIICRVSNVTPEMVCRYVERLPKLKMTEDAFRNYMGKRWFQNEHQAPEQWGLYYIDGTNYYPRFNHDVTIEEADAYLYHWMRNLIVINPYTRFKKQSDKKLVESIVNQLEKNPNEHDLKTIIRRIIDSDEPFVINEIIANALNNYSRALKVEIINKDEERYNVSLLPNYKELLQSKINMTKKEYFELFDGVKTAFDPDAPLQKIFYGAPGTGKSHRIKEQLKALNVPKENIFRTTFHPDSDFSTFVGVYKPTMKKQYRYDGKVKAKYYEDDDLANAKKDDVIIDKVIQYDFVPQTFIKAYVRAYQTKENVYLIIEEINRGNCAQIFGDLFQLLDRDENGVSEYTIKADADIRAYLEDVLGCDSEGIKDGELCLPSNLYIYATMNTSDQSLFPIDSAFKRRWDWEYEPIKYKNADWVIEINGNQFSWTSFQKEVNNRIFESTNSEDKMLGDFFVKPYDGIITEKLLLNKVLFYLWNDVCKDGDGDIFKTEDNKDVKFSDLYGENGTAMLLSMMKHLKVEFVLASDEDVEDDEEEQEDGVKVRYAINGEDKDEDGKDWKKGALVKRAVEIYCNNHPQDTATQIRDAWMSVGFLIPHIVETDDDKTQRINGSNDSRAAIRSREIRLSNGESLHVSTQVGDGKQRKGFSDFIAKIQSKPEWGINIQEV